MTHSCDLLVVGAGPAGIAAALRGRSAGLRVIVLERRRTPGLVPGETLHPGVEPLLDTLGLGAAVRAAGFARHEGIVVQWDGPMKLQPYGSDSAEPWRGFQADRRRLGTILWWAARNAGATIRAGCGPVAPVLARGRVVGVTTRNGLIRARWTVDATGRAAALAEPLGLSARYHSPPLCARFGWAQDGGAARDPRLTATPDGWNWEAPLGSGRLAWVRLTVGCDGRGLDLRWRTRPAAMPGLLVAGDAAALLDPASSHGVLRALMTGIMAAHLAAAEIGGAVSETDVLAIYESWLRGWFEHDAELLRDLYGRHPFAPVRRAFAADPSIPFSGRPGAGDLDVNQPRKEPAACSI